MLAEECRPKSHSASLVVCTEYGVQQLCCGHPVNQFFQRPQMPAHASRRRWRALEALYADSNLIITKHVSEFAAWDRDAVNQRQIWLAARAVAVCRFQ